MGFFSKIADIAGGSLVKTLVETAEKYYPPSMSDSEKATLSLALEKVAIERDAGIAAAIVTAEQALTERIAQSEGTAKDLLAMPILGRLIIFARGSQRPIWGFAAMYGDLMWFGGYWGALTSTQEQTLLTINYLVLGFLFGERAIQNVLPLVSQLYGKHSESKKDKK